MLAGGALAATSIYAAIKHPPLVSWIPDQRITNPSGDFATQYFRIIDYDGNGFTVMKQSTSSFYSTANVNVSQCSTQADFDAGCSPDDGYKVTFNGNPTADGVTTITLRAKETGTGGLIGYTSFTLRRDTTGNANPPTIAILPNYAVQIDPNTHVATYTTMFAIGDLNPTGAEDVYGNFDASDFTLHSSNTNLLPVTGISVELMPPDEDLAIEEGPRLYKLTATSSPYTTGIATVWIDLQDPQGNVSTTSFVLTVVAAANAQPTIVNTNASYEEQMLPATSASHAFTVTDNSPTNEVKVSAFSSNTNLVPNDFTNNLVVTQPDASGNGSVTITPVLPLPSPSPGRPQAATITLSVTDDAYTRQTTFLYVLAPPPGGVSTSFSRPGGVFTLDAKDRNRGLDSFLTGEQHGSEVTWNELEKAPDMTGDHFEWGPIDDVISNLPPGQTISLNLQQEPCYIATSSELVFNPWCDTDTQRQPDTCGTGNQCGTGGISRAVPWDPYLRQRRDNFLSMLKEHLGENIGVISIINPNLPGGDTGLRNGSLDVDDMDGYSREALLGAVQDELHAVQENFPNALVHFGFFKITDRQDLTYGDALWQWLYRDASNFKDANGLNLLALGDEFNGIRRPRVSFFEENLAATRTTDTVTRSSAPNYITPPDARAYTITPNSDFLPTFAYYPSPSEADLNALFNNGITFQATTDWTNPFMSDTGSKFAHTVNGSPNDGMEGAFNTYLSKYLEVYLPDIDQAQPPPPTGGLPTLNAALWAGELQSWHDYTDHLRDQAPIEPPAGLTVERAGLSSNLVTWFAVYGATSYQLQRIDFTASSPAWVDLAGCDPSQTQCTDTRSNAAPYGYRVRASNGTNTTPWANVAVFLSEGSYDGYVAFDGSNYQANSNAMQPGIRAGRGTSTDLRGVVSFDTSPLGAGVSVLGARLRLKQTTTNVAFDSLGVCLVDIKSGSFGSNPVLQQTDYDAVPSATNVTQLAGAGSGNWVAAELPSAAAASYVNPSDRTQFRLSFPSISGVSNKQAGWNSGESSDNEPQLIVQYR